MKDHEYINLSEGYEIKDWLRRNFFRQTEQNISTFEREHSRIKELLSKRLLKWQEFDGNVNRTLFE